MASYKVEVIADSSGQWRSNQLRFARLREAISAGRSLFDRWTAVSEMRVCRCDDAVNARYADGKVFMLRTEANEKVLANNGVSAMSAKTDG